MLEILDGKVYINDVDNFLNGLKEISMKHGVVIQTIDARKVAGRKHLETAVKKAIRSTLSGKNIADDLAMEILLYASGKRHIDKAIEMGISPGMNEVAIVIVGSPGGVGRVVRALREETAEEDVVGYKSSKRGEIMRFFDITEEELAAVGEEKIVDIVTERAVLLDILK